MCNNDNPPVTLPTAVSVGASSSSTLNAGLASFAMKPVAIPQPGPEVPATAFGPTTALSQVALDYHRLQLYDYACATAAAGRIRYGPHPGLAAYPIGPYVPNQAATFAVAAAAGLYGHHPFAKFDPRARFVHEEPKPQHSYIGLIGMAILSCPDKKMVLSDIYQYILDNYPYFRNRGPGWRNSIRHNLSLNDCFIKAGRSANGKGHYWAVHPANVEDFQKGDFRRRKAQRKVRKHMGLSVPDDEDSPSPPPPPPPVLHAHHQQQALAHNPLQRGFWHATKPGHPLTGLVPGTVAFPHELQTSPQPQVNHNRRRQFDVESLLAPDRLDQGDLSTSDVSDTATDSPSTSPTVMRASDGNDATRSKKIAKVEENVEPVDLENKEKKDRRDEDSNGSAEPWQNPLQSWSNRLANGGRTVAAAAAVAAMAAAMQGNNGAVTEQDVSVTMPATNNNSVFLNPLAAAAVAGLSRHSQQQQHIYHHPIMGQVLINGNIVHPYNFENQQQISRDVDTNP